MFNSISKRPPSDGTKLNSVIAFLYSISNCSAILAAFSSYPQAEQYVSLIFIMDPRENMGVLVKDYRPTWGASVIIAGSTEVVKKTWNIVL